MAKDQFTIEVSEVMYNRAKEGDLNVITSHLDPKAEKDLLEGARPTEICIKARGTRKGALTFQVVGFPDRVLKGYQVKTKKGYVLDVMSRLTGRVVIGSMIDTKATEKDEEAPKQV